MVHGSNLRCILRRHNAILVYRLGYTTESQEEILFFQLDSIPILVSRTVKTQVQIAVFSK